LVVRRWSGVARKSHPFLFIHRAAVSVPSNIAEGKGHRSNTEFSHFLFHARSSLLELQTQLMIAEQLQYLPKAESRRLLALAEGVAEPSMA